MASEKIRNLDLRKNTFMGVSSGPKPQSSSLSPQSSLKRSARYAAAKTTKSTGDWMPVDGNVNTIIRASSAVMRSRVRQLVRDFPYFARAVNVLVDYIVGEGIYFQSRVTTPSGDLNRPLIQKIEDAFDFWADKADFSGKLHFYEMMRLAKRQDVEVGEFLIVKRYVKDRRRYLPLALQIIEPDWLSSFTMDVAPGNEIDQGIEYEKESGRVIAYHFTDPDGWGKTVRVPAENVIHKYDMLRPGQLRGVSPFAPGILLADDLAQLMDSEIDAAKTASKFVALIKTPDIAGRQMGMGTDPQTGDKIEELENAILEYLRPGEEVELTSNPRPGSNFSPFVRLILTMFSITAGVPYELLSGDYQGMNYSTGKMIRNDFAQQLRPAVKRHVRHYCDPALMPFFETLCMSGKVPMPGYFTNPASYLRREWQPPGQESIDPSRETKSRIDEIDSRLRSPQEIIKARGRDPEQVVTEIAAFQKLCKDNGIEPLKVSTALANNPAAIEEQGRHLHILYEINDKLDELMGR